MDLLRFGRIMGRSVRFLVAAALVGALVGVGVGFLRESTAQARKSAHYYSATETLGYDASAVGSQSNGGASDLDTVGIFATGQPVSSEVAKQLGGDSGTLAAHITTVVRPATNSVDITAVSGSASGAERLAGTFASVTSTKFAAEVAARANDQATELGKRLDDLKTKRQSVAQQLLNPNLSSVDRDTLQAQSDALVNGYRIAYDRFINLGSPDLSAAPLFTLARPRAISIDAATYQAALRRGRSGHNHFDAAAADTAFTPAASSSYRLPSGPVPLGALGAVLGLLVGVAIVTLRARFDSKLRTRPDFEEAFGLPILGGVPVLAYDELAQNCLVAIEKPYSPSAEVFRAVRSGLLLLGTDDPDRQGALIVMITSSQPKEGKTTNCANLAAAFAESGRSVLAVNCDYRRPNLHRYFDLENEAGVIQATHLQGLSVVTNITASGTSPGRIAAEQRAFIQAHRFDFDVILLDTTPLLSTSDPIDIVSVADFVLMIGRPGYTERDHAFQTMELLARHRATTAGLLMTAVDPLASDYYYAYSTYSSYNAPPADASDRD